MRKIGIVGIWQMGLLTGVFVMAVGVSRGQEPKAVPAGTPVTITVSPATPSSPPVTINLLARQGRVTPIRSGCTHTGGGNIDVAQPSADTIVVTMTGVAVAYCGPRCAVATLMHDLEQCFEVSFDNPKVKKARLTLEARVIGLLRSHCKGGTAEVADLHASVTDGPAPPLAISLQPYSVVGGENRSINDREGPSSIPVTPGKYRLRQTFRVTATAPKCLLPAKAPSAEFAPDPALDPLWISFKEPFKGAAKKDFGFQVTLKVAEDTSSDNDKKEEKDARGTDNGKSEEKKGTKP